MSQDWDSVTWRPTKMQSPTTKRTLRARYFDDILLLCWSYALTTVLFCGVGNLEWQTLHSTIPLFINSTTSPHQYYVYSTQSFKNPSSSSKWNYGSTSTHLIKWDHKVIQNPRDRQSMAIKLSYLIATKSTAIIYHRQNQLKHTLKRHKHPKANKQILLNKPMRENSLNLSSFF